MEKRRKNKKEIIFSLDFYHPEAIKAAIRDFSETASFELEKADGKKMKVTISDYEASLEPVIREEFANYVLGLSYGK